MSGARPARALVLGGGVAGLTAAFGLADRGYRVELLESRQWCGGRAFASDDRVFARRLDNGFHVMLGCYRATRALLRRLGTEELFQQDPSLVMHYRFGPQRATGLRLSRLPVPLAMPIALFRLGIGFGSRLRAMFGMATVAFGAPRAWTFADWLRRRWQVGEPDDVMWRPLCRAVMNCEPEDASAREFLATLREAFFGRAASAAMWVPRATWGELIGDPAPQRLREAGVELRTGARVASLVGERGAVRAVVLGDGTRVEVPDGAPVVSAMPWFALRRVLDDGEVGAAADEPLRRLAQLRSAPIVTAYFDVPAGAASPPDEGPVTALVGARPFHFLLRHPGDPVGRFALLSGGDRDLDGRPVAEIAAAAVELVRRYYDVDAAEAPVRIRKEQHATFVPEPGDELLRPRPGRLCDGLDNLFVCGDWTATGLPATLEGAARSAETVVGGLPDRRRG